MNLKDIMNADIDDVFLDPDEFAELHNINGKQILCIVDEDISKQRSNRQSTSYDGVYLIQVTLFVRESALGYRPERDRKITVDGKWYEVLECSGQDLLEVTLGSNQV